MSSLAQAQEKFIDECVNFGQDQKSGCLCKLPTGHLLVFEDDEEVVKSEKSTGRWTIKQSFVYLKCLKEHKSTKVIVKEILKQLPKRIEPQVRAHHQKMLKKYGSREKVISCLDIKQNYELLDLNVKLFQLKENLEAFVERHN